MLKCNTCGAANDDGQKFCSECGNKLVADADRAAAEAVGAEANGAPTEKVCPACGSKNGATENFCSECGKSLNDAEAGKSEPTAGEAPTKEYKKNFGGTVERVKDKTMTFENKHHVIANAFIAALAVVFMLVALLAPVKYTMYDFDPTGALSAMNMYASNDDYDYGDDYDFDEEWGDKLKITERAFYLSVNQSVFNSLSAAQALTLDFSKESDQAKYVKYMKEFTQAMQEGVVELALWMDKHPEAMEWEEDKLMDKAMEFFVKPLSKINLMRVEAASLRYELYEAELRSEAGDNNSSGITDQLMADLFNLSITLIMNSVIVLLAFVIAIISLIYLIKSIIGIVKKTPTDNGLFKLICTVMSLAASCIALMSIAPSLKVGGGMFAIMLVGAIIAIVCGAVSSLVNKVHKPFAVIKNAAIGIVVTVAFFLLCTDIITLKVAYGSDMSSTTYGPLGYAMYTAFNSLTEAIGNSPSPEMMGVCVSGVVVAVLLTVAVSLFGQGVAKRLRYNACGVVTKKNGSTVGNAYGTGSLIGGLVVGFIGVMFALVGSPVMYRTIADSIAEEDATLPAEMVISFGVRAQVFVSFVLTLVALIVSAVFKTEKIGKKKSDDRDGDKPATETVAA